MYDLGNAKTASIGGVCRTEVLHNTRFKSTQNFLIHKYTDC